MINYFGVSEKMKRVEGVDHQKDYQRTIKEAGTQESMVSWESCENSVVKAERSEIVPILFKLRKCED